MHIALFITPAEAVSSLFVIVVAAGVAIAVRIGRADRRAEQKTAQGNRDRVASQRRPS